jgi:hypothetical protein
MAALFREAMETGEQRVGELTAADRKIFLLVRVAP